MSRLDFRRLGTSIKEKIKASKRRHNNYERQQTHSVKYISKSKNKYKGGDSFVEDDDFSDFDKKTNPKIKRLETQISKYNREVPSPPEEFEEEPEPEAEQTDIQDESSELEEKKVRLSPIE